MPALSAPSIARQKWLCAAMDALKSRFERAGYTVPNTIRVSVGFPKGGTGGDKTIGQCFAAEASGDAYNEIFISPELGGKNDSVRIMGVIAHEMVHAVVGLKVGHKRTFKQCAVAIGLEGKMTATTESREFAAWAINLITEKIGEYPAGAMTLMGRKKQTTRMLKCSCDECGYIARVTRQWIESGGPPVCPTDQISMTCDAVDGEDDD
jgi:hypothetical protein